MRNVVSNIILQSSREAGSITNQNIRSIRRDIQGLRAISALLVVVFHIWFGSVSGGVDVFFVVSGYLMASSFVRRNRRLDVLETYSGFLTRVAPQALLTLACLLFIWPFFVTPFKWIFLFGDIFAGAVYLENLHLILRGDDYFSRHGIISFVQHFWAMSVIGQVCFSWPLIVAASMFIALKSKRSTTITLAGLMALLVVVSFVWGLWLTQTHPRSAYFDLFCRFWEFGVGALIGQAPQLRTLVRRNHAAILSWLGVAMVLSCGFLLGSKAQFPGYASLWPVAAAALILLASREDDPRNAGWMLATTPLTLVGGIAFGIYLWHWPLFVLMMETAPGPTLTFAQGVGLVVATMLIAATGNTFIERVAPTVGNSIRAVSLNARFGAYAVALSLACVGFAAKGAQRVLEKYGDEIERRMGVDTNGFRPGPLSINFDSPEAVLAGCIQVDGSEEAITCAFGDEGAATTIVLVGSSRSGHWLPALQESAEGKGWRLVNITKAGCPFSDPADLPGAKCKMWNEAAMNKILEMRPALVVTLATSLSSDDGRLTERMPDGYISWFEKLTAKGIPVVAIRSTPTMPMNVAACVFSHGQGDLDGCGTSREKVLDDVAFEQIRSKVPIGVGLLDMTDAFCDDQYCWPTRGNLIVYQDDRHVTASYMKDIAPVVAARLDRMAPKLLEEVGKRAMAAPAAAAP